MDPTTLFGLVLAAAGLIGGQLLEGGKLGSLVQHTALVIVVLGTLGAVMVQSPLPVFLKAVRMGRLAFVPPRLDGNQIIDQIVEWANAVRKDGILALDSRIEGIQEPIVRSGLQMLVDGFDGSSIREALDVEIAAQEQVEKDAAKVWESAGGYSPTIGIIGAVLGLIHVMENLADPSKLGGGIACAFVATIYGVALANLVFLPIAGKIKSAIGIHTLRSEIIQDGLVGIANGENPRLIASRLRGYLAH
ncbi:MAG: flagellar motor protein [Burkholderiaceae bacterium]|jgi:chemotaxis protein MotA